jgi:hypothetical protein
MGGDSSALAAILEEKKIEPYCLLVGSCFNPNGFSLAGVSIRVEMKLEPSKKVKKKKWELISSPRGEFAVRLPAGKNSFLITVAKKGYKTIEKTIEFANDERQDIVLNMELADR